MKKKFFCAILFSGICLGSYAQSRIADTQQMPHVHRFAELPNDNSFNGKPITWQIEIDAATIELRPDTLIKMATASYLAYERYFPISFVETSEKTIQSIIHYPKLTFRYEVFENGFAKEPHLVKLITIRKHDNVEIISD